MFRIGQKVVCIVNKDIWKPYVPLELVFPRFKEIYTIRDIQNFPNGLGIWLEEIRNPPFKFTEGWMENCWAASNFRPLIERKTDISIFLKLLNPDKELING